MFILILIPILLLGGGSATVITTVAMADARYGSSQDRSHSDRVVGAHGHR
jgi:hypothetical protein